MSLEQGPTSWWVLSCSIWAGFVLAQKGRLGRGDILHLLWGICSASAFLHFILHVEPGFQVRPSPQPAPPRAHVGFLPHFSVSYISECKVPHEDERAQCSKQDSCGPSGSVPSFSLLRAESGAHWLMLLRDWAGMG